MVKDRKDCRNLVRKGERWRWDATGDQTEMNEAKQEDSSMRSEALECEWNLSLDYLSETLYRQYWDIQSSLHIESI